MVTFQTKNPNLGKFCRVLQWKTLVIFNCCLVYLTAFCYILWPFVLFYGNLVHFSCSGMLYQEKSGNPVWLIESMASTIFCKPMPSRGAFGARQGCQMAYVFSDQKIPIWVNF
jgi:hypothetical protein